MDRSSFGRVAVVLMLIVTVGCSGLRTDSLGGLLGGGEDEPLNESTVAAGLKEALRIGTERSVAVTSKVDGFWGNALIRIVMPDEFEDAAKTLRTVGFGAQVDEFELAMNRTAELAAAEARSIFWDTITEMTIADAFGILNGGETAATDYFRARTSDRLRARFEPIVHSKMSEVGLYRIYNDLVDQYSKLPFVSKPAFDLDEYITENALNGLFTVLAQEEALIREDPAARTTDLLRRVFGH
jgi:hypothetical protein